MSNYEFYEFGMSDDDREEIEELKEMIEVESQDPFKWGLESYNGWLEPLLEKDEKFTKKNEQVTDLLDGCEVRVVFCVAIHLIEMCIKQVCSTSESYAYTLYSALRFWLQQSFRNNIGRKWDNAFTELNMEHDDTFRN